MNRYRKSDVRLTWKELQHQSLQQTFIEEQMLRFHMNWWCILQTVLHMKSQALIVCSMISHQSQPEQWNSNKRINTVESPIVVCKRIAMGFWHIKSHMGNKYKNSLSVWRLFVYTKSSGNIFAKQTKDSCQMDERVRVCGAL